MIARAAAVALVALAACDRHGAEPAHDHGAASCVALAGGNPVQTEMQRLECALTRAVVALGRDDLGAVRGEIHAVHQARIATERAIADGAWRPARGELDAFVALDDVFHRELEALVAASSADDHAATAAALGRALGQCQGCHAAFRDPR